MVARVMSYANISSDELVSKATELIQGAATSVLANVKDIVSYPINFTLNFIFILLMLFFLFVDGYRLSDAFYKFLPFPNDIEKDVVGRMKQVVRVLLTGNLLIMICQGLMVGLGLFIAGIQVALLGGSIAAILSLIPVVGTTLVWGPAVVYLIITGSYLKAVFLGIWCFGWYLVLENLVKPKIFGARLHFHPVIFFFLLLGSIQAFGLPGIFFGPLILTLFYSFWEIYKILHGYELAHEKDVYKPSIKSRKLRP
jgi:predicted PurR-regulated permease PerM